MSDRYVIQWKSKVNGRAGRGSRKFSKAEAARLAEELNREYPEIEHNPILAPPPEEPELASFPEEAEMEMEEEQEPRFRRKHAVVSSR